MREILEDSIRRLLRDQVGPELLHDAETGRWPSALWNALEGNGFTQALVREESGGSGLAWADAYPIVAAAGEHALPLPLPETVLGNWLLDLAGLPVAGGPIGLADPGDAPLPVARQADRQWRVWGRISHVPWGRHAHHLVLAVQVEGQVHLAWLENRGLDWLHDTNLAREPRDAAVLEGAPALAVAPWPLDGGGELGLRQHGAMLRSAQMAGAMGRLLQQSVGYAMERVQFGRPIGNFQAIQQQLAVLACERAAVSMGAAFAFEQAATPEASLAAAAAKVRASQAAGQASAIAHATHGAIGFTYEHSLHFATRRLWAWRSEFGHHAWWACRVGQAIRRSDQPFWHLVTRGDVPLARQWETT